MKIVFIGADPTVAEMVALSVRLRWPDVVPLVAREAGHGLELVEQASPDVVIMRPDFPDIRMSQAILELRAFSSAPLLVLSNAGDSTEAVTALEMGADDYVRLPCDLIELMIRVWALLRRFGLKTSPEQDKPLVSGELFMNPATYEVWLGCQPISLTSTEFRLLHLLVKNQGMVVSHQMLERNLWGDAVDSSELVKKYVQRLRRKLGDSARDPRWIASVKGVGYRFIGSPPRE